MGQLDQGSHRAPQQQQSSTEEAGHDELASDLKRPDWQRFQQYYCRQCLDEHDLAAAVQPDLEGRPCPSNNSKAVIANWNPASARNLQQSVCPGCLVANIEVAPGPPQAEQGTADLFEDTGSVLCTWYSPQLVEGSAPRWRQPIGPTEARQPCFDLVQPEPESHRSAAAVAAPE